MTSDAGGKGSVPTLRIAAAQINTTVGDLEGNVRLIKDWIGQSQEQGVDLVTFPELTITGYPPEDLVLYDNFIAANKDALTRIAATVDDIVAIVGFVDSENGKLFNAAAVLHQQKVVATYRKIHLPNYGVFDEQRYFNSGDECLVLSIRGLKVGINICEDIWELDGPSEVQHAAGAQIIVNLNASPYELGKQGERLKIVTDLSRRNHVFTLYANQVGGQDELIFDGGSMLVGPAGELLSRSAQFEEALLVADIDIRKIGLSDIEDQSKTESDEKLGRVGQARVVNIKTAIPDVRPPLRKLSVHQLDKLEAAYRALVIGTRDYLKKTGFKKVAIAVSGGIDSALVTTIAVEAIGSGNVVGVSLPSRYSSQGSIVDAQDLCSRLEVEMWQIPIERGHTAFENMLQEVFEGTKSGVSEENSQARIRGNLMMAIANKFGWLILTTGNKSEMATGYATLYGDMAGAYAVIKDVPKTLVYELSKHRNQRGPGSPIPQTIIEKPPSAELRPDQLDRDSLPPYAQLDRIIQMYIEERMSTELIVNSELENPDGGANAATIERIIRLVDTNEYKRRQSPPGPKITGLAFGKDRRLPIASRWQK